ncbi:MAG: hypothetical protein WED34_04820 [Planctomycetales bacterium]
MDAPFLFAQVVLSAADYQVLKDLLFPLLLGAVGGGVSLIAHIFIQANSERYRQLAHWEGYAVALWEARMPVYRGLTAGIYEMSATVQMLFKYPKAGESTESREVAVQMLNEKLDAVTDLEKTILAIGSMNVIRRVTTCLTLARSISDEWVSGTLAEKRRAEFRNATAAAVSALRTELNVDVFDKRMQARIGAILEPRPHPKEKQE